MPVSSGEDKAIELHNKDRTMPITRKDNQVIITYGDEASAASGMMELATKYRMTVGIDEMQTAAKRQMRELQD